ncbi:hypothetical protein CNYM01_09849 [Colletotrichum nymphaeae SA-01]|uniref:Uncharacterized protein n=1 Tax=Colletotrichum nymphaeae SA-01 TaxID=1460502 RepID=A0A135UG56_9PEZI|nr:hypothetical protein CNYM01_09849 [Colletotrichum nymphaeae SA-01]
MPPLPSRIPPPESPLPSRLSSSISAHDDARKISGESSFASHTSLYPPTAFSHLIPPVSSASRDRSLDFPILQRDNRPSSQLFTVSQRQRLRLRLRQKNHRPRRHTAAPVARRDERRPRNFTPQLQTCDSWIVGFCNSTTRRFSPI